MVRNDESAGAGRALVLSIWVVNFRYTRKRTLDKAVTRVGSVRVIFDKPWVRPLSFLAVQGYLRPPESK